MAKKLDQIIVVDLEATCWEGDPPPGEESEIIEIGICLLDVRTGERTYNMGLLIMPTRSRLSPYCTQLTTLTDAQLDSGLTFKGACEILIKDFDANRRTWASFGDYDRWKIQEQCTQWGVNYPFGSTHINIKNLVALQFNLKKEVGLPHALDLLGLPLEGTHHRGMDDAWNIAAVLDRVLLQGRRQR